MSLELTPHDIIVSALRLPEDQREQVIDALSASLFDPSINHGPDETNAEELAAWAESLARRVAQLDSRQVVAIPADEAERMIRDIARPSV